MRFIAVLILGLMTFHSAAWSRVKKVSALQRTTSYRSYSQKLKYRKSAVIPLPAKRVRYTSTPFLRPMPLSRRLASRDKVGAPSRLYKRAEVDAAAIDRAISALGGYDPNHIAAADAVDLSELDSLALQDVNDAAVAEIRPDRSKVVNVEPKMKKWR
jgi:hypothetical protein